MRQIAAQIEGRKTEYDITRSAPGAEVTMDDGDLLVVGMPVYSGRIPASALPALRKFRGNGTPAVVVCVYGNRDYDDALLELTDVVGENGFRVAAAAAFVAQHSIFPQVGTNRPDEEDIRRIAAFVRQFRRKIDSAADSASLQEVVPPGGRPYKTPGKVPLRPTGGRKCTGCGVCVERCPVQAIPAGRPRQTDPQKCIACGRCTKECPNDAIHVEGGVAKIDEAKCTRCGACAKVCPCKCIVDYLDSIE